VIYWRLKHVVLTSVTDPQIADVALGRDTNGVTANRVVCRHKVPFGAEAWAYNDRGPWRSLTELPADWATTIFQGES
jgi:hypothetical protein